MTKNMAVKLNRTHNFAFNNFLLNPFLGNILILQPMKIWKYKKPDGAFRG